MMVVTPDKALRRAVKRLTTATGASAQFVEHESEINSSKPIDLAIFDARERDPIREFTDRVPANGRILYILEGKHLSKRLRLFESNQATSLFCYDDQFDDDEFISSATKALRGDIFGLQKYFPWGVTTFTMRVKSYDQKAKAIDIMMAYAKTAGVRGPVRDRIQLVADELMMNALYHAPTDEAGNEQYANMTQKQLAQLSEVTPIEVQYGCSGRYFGISVRDGFGSLTRIKALNYLARAANSQATIEDKTSGAGLGLISVLQSVSKLIFNLEPMYSTEAVALFDMQLQTSGAKGARSLHIFTAKPQDDSATTSDNNEAVAKSKSRSGTWAIAAVLGAVVASLATAVILKNTTPPTPATVQAAKVSALVVPTVTVIPTPAQADITINGTPIQAGVPVPVDLDESSVIEIQHEGFKNWKKEYDADFFKIHPTLLIDLSKMKK